MKLIQKIKISQVLLCMGVLMTLAGCSSTMDQYKGQQPELKLEKFFNGKIKAWGVVMSRSGVVKRRFVADLVGEWKGNTGVLKEDFVYDNGEKQYREWTLKVLEDGRITGTASDVDGEAAGQTSGFAMNWKYVLKLNLDGSIYHISFDDGMYLVDEKSMINKAKMTKFGFNVGEVLLFMQKLD